MRFKPGDKAKIVGEQVVIVEYDKRGWYLVAGERRPYNWCVADCDIEPLEASPVIMDGCEVYSKSQDDRKIKASPVQEEESRPSVKDYFDDINEAADQYTTAPKLFRYAQAVDNYADHLETTISNLRKELEELKKQKI